LYSQGLVCWCRLETSECASLRVSGSNPPVPISVLGQSMQRFAMVSTGPLRVDGGIVLRISPFVGRIRVSKKLN
jgi:hypothetical protein